MVDHLFMQQGNSQFIFFIFLLGSGVLGTYLDDVSETIL